MVESDLSIPSSWCPLPWSHVSIKNDGTFRLCCHANIGPTRGTLFGADGAPLNAATSSWKDAVNSETMKEVRASMLIGQWHPACTRCSNEFKAGVVPRNIFERDLEYSSVDFVSTKQLTNSDGSINPTHFPVKNIDMRFGNTCNLKCVMCSPRDSNQWYQDHVALTGETEYDEGHYSIKLYKTQTGEYRPQGDSYKWFDDTRVWDELTNASSTITKIYIAGGEPFLIKKHFQWLERCVELDIAKDITLEYSTNLTHIPDSAFGIWKKFKKVIFGISLDSIGEKNHLIRYPSDWSLILGNIRKLDGKLMNATMRVAISVQILNIFDLPEILNFWLTQSITTVPVRITLHPVHRPYFFNLSLLSESTKLDIKRNLDGYLEKIKLIIPESENHHHRLLEVIKITRKYSNFVMSYSNSANVSFHRNKFIHTMDKLDELRKTNWRQTFPEVWEATKEWKEE